MDLFEILTEARIREWEQRTEGGALPPAPEETLAHESLDQQLLREIESLLKADEVSREGVERARGLEVQLMASLEKRGLHLTARRIQCEL